jgi:YbbR domain-containing protein
VRSVLDFLLRNWPLRLAAIGLATVLYAGVALSGNTRTWPGQVPIEVLNPPAGGSLLELPGSVSNIRYRAPLDVAGQLTTGSFRASVDLSNMRPTAGGEPVVVPVELLPLDPRVEIVGYTPEAVNIRMDEVVSRTFPVTVDRGVVPEGLVVGPPQVQPPTVLIRGASSRVGSIHDVVARVAIDASGLNVDQQSDVEVLDETGSQVAGVDVTPERVQVRMDVAQEQGYATVPVVPVLTGDPAEGHEVTGVSTNPRTVTVSGEAPAVQRLSSVRTRPVDLAGRDQGFSEEVGLEVPAEVTVIGDATVVVAVELADPEVSRTFQVGVSLQGARPDRTYLLSTPSVNVTVRGPRSLVDGLRPGAIRVRAPVGRLSPGPHEVELNATAPDELTVDAVAPARIDVRVSPATPAPPATPTPSVAPDAPVASPVAGGG